MNCLVGKESKQRYDTGSRYSSVHRSLVPRDDKGRLRDSGKTENLTNSCVKKRLCGRKPLHRQGRITNKTYKNATQQKLNSGTGFWSTKFINNPLPAFLFKG